MFCKYCGTKLTEDSVFCPVCGQIQQQQAASGDAESAANAAESVPTPAYTPVTESTPEQQQRSKRAGSTLLFGILGLAFALEIPLLGFIFSIIGKSKAASYLSLYGELDGRALVGQKLSVAGFIVGLIGTILVTLYVVIWVIALFSGNANMEFNVRFF